MNIDAAIRCAHARAMARIHLVVGPVGAGKSTFALELCRAHGAIRLTLDEWMTNLFSMDRPPVDVLPWYMERAERCVGQIWRITQRLIDHGTDVVLEIGLIQRNMRESFYQRVDADAQELVIYVLDAPRELRRQRVAQRNLERGQTFSMVVPPEFFELASDHWEPLADDECEGRDVRFVGGQ
jgi:predicted kinase